MAKPLVGVVISSRAEFNIMRRGLELFRMLGVPYVVEIASATRAPERLAKFAVQATDLGMEVLVCGAGGSATVAGTLASYSSLPIVAVPIDATPLRGQDALFSMAQMAPGVPVATVGINSSENAALLATQILAIKYPKFRSTLARHRTAFFQRLETTRRELLSEYPDLCDPRSTAAPKLLDATNEVETEPGENHATPDMADAETPPARTDVIHPGAAYAEPAGGSLPQTLIKTPTPQEPGTVTEDPALTADLKRARENHSENSQADIPPPPDFEDLRPRASDTPLPPGDAQQEMPEAAAHEIIETKVFPIDSDEPDEDVLSHAMMVLIEGGIVAFPTDTVYGLAVDASNPDAVRRLYEAKGHEPQRKNLSVLLHTQSQLDDLVREVPPELERVLDRYWPGGLTVLFFKQASVLASVTETPSIAIRIPDHAVALRLMEMVQRPLAVINAALPNKTAAATAGEVLERFEGRVHCVLDSGPCDSNEISTVLSVLSEPFEILREGAIPAAELRELLGDKVKVG